jgi:hypothetical protein
VVEIHPPQHPPVQRPSDANANANELTKGPMAVWQRMIEEVSRMCSSPAAPSWMPGKVAAVGGVELLVEDY